MKQKTPHKNSFFSKQLISLILCLMLILIHNPFNTYDASSIVVLNKQLQQIGHLTPHGGFNKKIGNLIKWQPYVADVIEVYPNFTEVFIEISVI
jgi:hypothetical protein